MAPIWTLAAAVFVIALLYASVGHAGATGYLAVMAIAGLSPEMIRPTALSLNVVVATIATVQFARAGHFRGGLFWPLARQLCWVRGCPYAARRTLAWSGRGVSMSSLADTLAILTPTPPPRHLLRRVMGREGLSVSPRRRS